LQKNSNGKCRRERRTGKIKLAECEYRRETVKEGKASSKSNYEVEIKAEGRVLFTLEKIEFKQAIKLFN
jgi:hypothetical protein